MAIISKNIPIDADIVIKEIQRRQNFAWNNGRINDNEEFPTLMELFKCINSGIPVEDFFYRGPIYRIHTSYSKSIELIDNNKEFVVGTICRDKSCSVLPFTEENEKVCAFSKDFDFTKPIFYKVYSDETAIFLRCDTGNMYGIDVCTFLNRFNVPNRFEDEREVLFPVYTKNIIKEYKCTPNQFNYYMRNIKE